jgi:hypothetical protein
MKLKEQADLRKFLLASGGLIGVFIVGIGLVAFFTGRLG